jgi:putative ABC transport system permease protein
MIFASLSRVQAMANRSGQLDAIEVSALCKGCPVEDIVAQIQAKLPHAKVSAVQQAVKAREEMVGRLSRFSLAVALVVLLIGALMIFTTMMGAVVERTREIGVLRAVGFRRTHIIQGLVEEVATVSLLGGFFGWAAGIGAAWIAMPYFTENAVRELHPEFLAFALIAGVTVGIFSSVYPALRASRLDPAEAVRSI